MYLFLSSRDFPWPGHTHRDGHCVCSVCDRSAPDGGLVVHLLPHRLVTAHLQLGCVWAPATHTGQPPHNRRQHLCWMGGNNKQKEENTVHFLTSMYLALLGHVEMYLGVSDA